MRRFATLVALAALALAGAACASSDLKLVSRALASRHYHDGRYQRECTAAGIPVRTPACEDFRVLVDNALEEANLCNATQKLGPLPAPARKRLKLLMKQMDAYPDTHP